MAESNDQLTLIHTTSTHIYKTCNQKKEEYIEQLERVSHGGEASQAGRQATVRTNISLATYGFGFLMAWLSMPVPQTSRCRVLEKKQI